MSQDTTSEDHTSSPESGAKTKTRKRRSHQPVHARRKKQRFAIGIFFIAFLTAVGAGFWWVNSRVAHSNPEALCAELKTKLTETTGLRIDLLDPSYDAGHLQIGKLRAVGEPGTLIQSIDATGLSIPLSLWQRILGNWHTGAIHVDTAAVILTQPKRQQQAEPTTTPTTLSFPDSSLIKKLDISRIEVESLGVQWGEEGNQLSCSEATFQRSPNSWITELQCKEGQIQLKHWPELPLKKLTAQLSQETIVLNEILIASVDSAIQGQAEGTVGMGQSTTTQLTGQLRGLQLSRLLPRPQGWGDWINGELDIKWQYVVPAAFPSPRSPLQPGLVGSLSISGLEFQNVPLLNSLAEATAVPALSGATFDKPLRTNLSWNGNTLTLHQIMGSGRDSLGLGGTLTVSGEAGELDGHLLVGLHSDLLSKVRNGIPSFFSRQTSDGRYWTRARLTGTIKVPQDDLRSRLSSHIQASTPQSLPTSSAETEALTTEPETKNPWRALLDYYIETDSTSDAVESVPAP